MVAAQHRQGHQEQLAGTQYLAQSLLLEVVEVVMVVLLRVLPVQMVDLAVEGQEALGVERATHRL